MWYLQRVMKDSALLLFLAYHTKQELGKGKCGNPFGTHAYAPCRGEGKQTQRLFIGFGMQTVTAMIKKGSKKNGTKLILFG